jgi:hypothetical protein
MGGLSFAEANDRLPDLGSLSWAAPIIVSREAQQITIYVIRIGNRQVYRKS